MSVYVHEKSGHCVNTALGLFTVLPTQTLVEKGYWIKVQPIAVPRYVLALTIMDIGHTLIRS